MFKENLDGKIIEEAKWLETTWKSLIRIKRKKVFENLYFFKLTHWNGIKFWKNRIFGNGLNKQMPDGT